MSNHSPKEIRCRCCWIEKVVLTPMPAMSGSAWYSCLHRLAMQCNYHKAPLLRWQLCIVVVSRPFFEGWGQRDGIWIEANAAYTVLVQWISIASICNDCSRFPTSHVALSSEGGFATVPLLTARRVLGWSEPSICIRTPQHLERREGVCTQKSL